LSSLGVLASWRSSSLLLLLLLLRASVHPPIGRGHDDRFDELLVRVVLLVEERRELGPDRVHLGLAHLAAEARGPGVAPGAAFELGGGDRARDEAGGPFVDAFFFLVGSVQVAAQRAGVARAVGVDGARHVLLAASRRAERARERALLAVRIER